MTKTILLVTSLALISSSKICAQSQIDHQIIAEFHETLNVLNGNSKLNPDNIAHLGESENLFRLYPIFNLKGAYANLHLDTKLETSLFEEAQGGEPEFKFHEAYASFHINDRLYLAIGKQRFGWGSGIIWNPTSVEAPKNPFRINDRREGVNAIRLEVDLANFSIITAILPEEQIVKTNIALKVETQIKGLFLAVMSRRLDKNHYYLGLDFNWGGEKFTFYGESVVRNWSKQRFVDPDGRLLNRPLVSTLRNTYADAVIGLTLTPFEPWYMLSEYHFRKDANSRKEYNNFMEFLPAHNSIYDPISMGRHTFFMMIQNRDSFMANTNLSLKVYWDPLTNQTLFFPDLEMTHANIQFTITHFMFLQQKEISIFDARTRIILSLYF